MQHINDDIDDLLRNAAESYPLKIKGADWESIADRLQSEEAEQTIVVPFENPANRYRKYLLAMLLIPVGLILAKYAGLIGGGDGRTAVPPNERTVKVVPKTDTKQGDGAAVGDKGANKSVAVQPFGNTVNTVDGSVQNTKSRPGGDLAGGAVSKNNAQFNMRVAGNDIARGSTVAENKTPSNVPRLSDLPVLEHQQQLAANSNNDEVLGASGHPAAQTGDKIDVATPPVKESVAPSETIKPSQAQSQAKTPATLAHNNKIKNRFYIGAFVAPEYATVKYQPGSKIGFNFGGFVGYKFMKNLSVEVGLAAGRKYYTSNGKYFNSTESWLSGWGKILNISGYANLTEFPINFKYDFKPSKEGNFFVAAGVISYIVHQENYDYVLDKNGVVYTRDKSPIVATDNLFANASISGGYESSLGGVCNFRIEPYYRIPLKGIGIGNLPITSMGLNIGIIKKFK